MINESNMKENRLAVFNQITKQMEETYKAKNHDYGNSFSDSITDFGLIAAAVRMNDKMNRIKSFVKMPEEEMKVKDESIQDTLLDLANYAVMTLVEIKVND